MEDQGIDRVLKEGIAAARAGQRAQARELLLQVIAQDEGIEAAWLWLSGVVDEPEEKLICLENVLTLNPANTAAQDGIRWLKEQGLAAPQHETPPQAGHPPEAGARPVLAPVPEAAPPAKAKARAEARIEFDSFGCPYCGGPVGAEDARCVACGRSVALRQRRREGGASLGWLVVFFLILGATAWLEGYLVTQVSDVVRLPEWLTRTGIQLLVGSALFTSEGVQGELAGFAGTLMVINYIVAGLCVLVAAGLALKIRAAYFGAFLLAGLLVLTTGIGLLVGLTGWLPALFRVGMVAVSLKWLTDNSQAFEWQTRHYDASLDRDLKTDLDYYDQGQHYRAMGMWAKAAAHWQVAARLAPSQAQYHISLANAYLRLDEPAAARIEADRALALTPEDGKLRAFRDSLADMEAAQ